MDPGRPHHAWNDAAPRPSPHGRCHRGAQAARGRRRHPGQAAADRRRLRRPPSRDHCPRQPLGRPAMARGLVQRLGRGHGGGAVLRIAGHGHRGLHPLSIGRQRHHGAQAHLGQGEPPRRLRIGRVPGPHRPDGAQCRRCRSHARGHRRGGPAGPYGQPVQRARLSGHDDARILRPAPGHGPAMGTGRRGCPLPPGGGAGPGGGATPGCQRAGGPLSRCHPGGGGLAGAVRGGDRRGARRHVPCTARGLWPRARRADRPGAGPVRHRLPAAAAAPRGLHGPGARTLRAGGPAAGPRHGLCGPHAAAHGAFRLRCRAVLGHAALHLPLRPHGQPHDHAARRTHF